MKRALELAEGGGAEGLAKKSAEELKLAHGRQHRRETDPDALTPAELRVCSLAELGVKPVVIASQLFLTLNTIETHLQHIYRKLGIKTRAELGRLIGNL